MKWHIYMKFFCKTVLIIVLFVSSISCKAQSIVFNQKRFSAVLANGAVRSAAEGTHNQYIDNINDKLNDINLNATSVVLAQEIIYNGLSQVNSALKNGIAVKNIAVITADILHYLNEALKLARNDPALLLATKNMQSECRARAVTLATDVSGFILKSGGNMLADYNARDELLKTVVNQLRIINGLAYGAWRAMYWAKERGIIATLNPFKNYISKDHILVEHILQSTKYLN